MKLHLDRTTSQNLITAYGDGFVQVNAVRHVSSVLVSAESVEPWGVTSLASLDDGSFKRLVEIKPELIIIGTGRTFHFLPPALLRALIDARIGHEVMSTPAACRTYNILLAEGRNVVAALAVE
jgi:uncharacterized protein